MKYMIDFRCPRCNQPVNGGGINDDVLILMKMPPQNVRCHYCQVRIEIVRDEDDLEIPGEMHCYSYRTAPSSYIERS